MHEYLYLLKIIYKLLIIYAAGSPVDKGINVRTNIFSTFCVCVLSRYFTQSEYSVTFYDPWLFPLTARIRKLSLKGVKIDLEATLKRIELHVNDLLLRLDLFI